MISYPRSSIPIVPIFSWAVFSRHAGCGAPSVRDTGHVLYTSSGAAAIALALRDAGVGAGVEVLLPAYHCLSMVEPVRAIAARPVFYRLRRDLTVDLQDIESRIGSATRALLVTHYFGFTQDMSALRTLCDRRGLVLIEDCAHAFFGSVQGRPVGAYGDYAIASARKFFPIHDGGCLVSARRPVDRIQLRRAGLIYHVKAAMNIFEEAFGYGRARMTFLLLSLPLRLKDVVWRNLKRAQGTQTSIGPAPSSGFRYLAADWMDRRMSLPSLLVMALCPRARVVARRRHYYERLAAGLSGLTAARPLHPELPAEVVPYMFPFVVDDSADVFAKLKQRGMPIYRWEDLATDMCAVSNDYSQRLLQLPCHAELRESEIDWMIDCVRSTLTQTRASSSDSGRRTRLESAR